MQVTLLEKMMLIRLKHKSKNKVCSGICELFAKTYHLPSLSIYTGTEDAVKLLGVYIDQEAFSKANLGHQKSQLLNDPDLTEGFNFPHLLPIIIKNKEYNEIKIQSQPFGVCSYQFESWIIAVVFGGVDPLKRNRIGKEMNTVMEYLCSILLPLIMQEKEDTHLETNYMEGVGQKLLLSMMDLRGFLLLCLSLFQIHFNCENVSVSFVYQEQKYFFSNHEDQNNEFVREFVFSSHTVIRDGVLTISSSKNIFTSQQTHTLVKLALFYLTRIINQFLKPRINSIFYRTILMDLTRIFEALISHDIGLLDINLYLSSFFAEKMQLSDEENDILLWKVGTRQIGKIAIRVFSVSYTKSVEDEYHMTVRNSILKSISMLIENYDIMISDYSLFRSIEKATDFYYHFINHCYSNDIAQLDCLLKQASLSENFKLLVKEKIIDIKNNTCIEFRQCPLPIVEICPSKEGQQKCFNRESVLCSTFHKKCQECAFHHIHKEK